MQGKTLLLVYSIGLLLFAQKGARYPKNEDNIHEQIRVYTQIFITKKGQFSIQEKLSLLIRCLPIIRET